MLEIQVRLAWDQEGSKSLLVGCCVHAGLVLYGLELTLAVAAMTRPYTPRLHVWLLQTHACCAVRFSSS